jgi:hypothetical protein
MVLRILTAVQITERQNVEIQITERQNVEIQIAGVYVFANYLTLN